MTELLRDIKTEFSGIELDTINNDKYSLHLHFNYIQNELLPQLEAAINALKGE